MPKVPLFNDGEAIDVAYANIRSGRNELLQACREHCEDLWEKYERYADSHFLTEITRKFHDRYWEMYLAVTLMDAGYDISCPKPGPDVGIVYEGRRIWFDATCPGPGAQGAVDSVPAPIIGVAQYTPNDAMILRYANAIDAKRRQHRNWLDQGIVRSGDSFVIAVNPRNLGHEWGDTSPPRIVQAAFPIGSQYFTIDQETSEFTGSGYLYRNTLKKASGASVGTGVFMLEGYERVSALLCSRVDAGNRTRTLGADFQLVPNPNALAPLPGHFRLPGTYFAVELSEDEFTLTPEPPLT